MFWGQEGRVWYSVKARRRRHNLSAEADRPILFRSVYEPIEIQLNAGSPNLEGRVVVRGSCGTP